MAKTKRVKQKAWGVFDDKEKLRRTRAFMYNSYHVAITEAQAKLWCAKVGGYTVRPVTISWEVDE